MPRRLFFLLIFLTAGLSVSSQLAAQQVYVKDSLRVGVRAEPGNVATPISVVTTGMTLDIIERDGGYVKVRLSSGVEGWVKGTYLSDKAPSVIVLKELQVRFQALESKLEKQSQHEQATALNNRNLNAEIEQLKQANAELRIQLQAERQTGMASGLAYAWKIVLFLLVVLAGFALGVSWYRKLTMRRLAGLRY